ncbi:hypothetical protein N474_10545 [Pseudoalteromonas luteoviolacea CPMOR-2]|uniref:Uncharacterized protein n=1 Tax=Pseudoalteromonas luteoviolacea DSM 6061 TaxID=1365250 RepID=A0A166XBV0_9GAMM|nr:hypothetical protein N475_12960 [Pseudoalteromonas luteoviolacea DSM 6061]KZN56755.1 hypothetical protein N474_10545 [Pseudoalteromonas luteoviolacea CPMOR-2]
MTYLSKKKSNNQIKSKFNAVTFSCFMWRIHPPLQCFYLINETQTKQKRFKGN